jgi:hypothetical protein
MVGAVRSIAATHAHNTGHEKMNASISPIVTKSNLMKAYNAAVIARCFDRGRLNRALGIVQRNSTKLLADGRLDVTGSDWHLATIKSCDCEDHKRVKYCKHIIASMLLYKALKLEETK